LAAYPPASCDAEKAHRSIDSASCRRSRRHDQPETRLRWSGRQRARFRRANGDFHGQVL